jgi:hypothetical protein
MRLLPLIHLQGKAPSFSVMRHSCATSARTCADNELGGNRQLCYLDGVIHLLTVLSALISRIANLSVGSGCRSVWQEMYLYETNCSTCPRHVTKTAVKDGHTVKYEPTQITL